MRNDYLNLCCPNDVAWQRFVLSKGPELINQMIGGLRGWR